MASCWIIGKKARIAANGHEYVAEPFIVFAREDEADAACDMVERVSGERPMKAEGSLYFANERKAIP
jgi:hypothetical protein